MWWHSHGNRVAMRLRWVRDLNSRRREKWENGKRITPPDSQTPPVGLEGSCPSRIRSGWDQGAKREQARVRKGYLHTVLYMVFN